MRIVIKGADFSEVSIGKVTKDLSFRVCASTTAEGGVQGFANWDGTSKTNTNLFKISDDSVFMDSNQSNARLQTDYIEVVKDMTVSATAEQLNGTNSIFPWIVCFNSNKTLLTDASVYAVYDPLNTSGSRTISFVIPDGVKYIKVQSNTTAASNRNIFIGSMPE